jgi:hypothetical protein
MLPRALSKVTRRTGGSSEKLLPDWAKARRTARVVPAAAEPRKSGHHNRLWLTEGQTQSVVFLLTYSGRIGTIFWAAGSAGGDMLFEKFVTGFLREAIERSAPVCAFPGEGVPGISFTTGDLKLRGGLAGTTFMHCKAHRPIGRGRYELRNSRTGKHLEFISNFLPETPVIRDIGQLIRPSDCRAVKS